MKISWIPRALFTILALFTVITLVSCGNLANDPLAGGGIGGTGISVGKITAFGSVFVNGVEFDIETADIKLDGTSGTKDELKIGMVVTVKGTFDANGKTGTASAIEFKDNMEGPITSVDTTNNTFVVLGQTVIVDSATILEDTTVIPGTEVKNNIAAILDALNKKIGDIVKVSGFVEADGKTIRATYIKLKTFTQGEEIELKGIISSIDNSAKTFTIGSLTVDFSNIPDANLSVGEYIEVKSTSGIINDVLIASKVEAENQLPEHKEGDKAEIQGFVTEFTSASEFKVNGQPVQTDQYTRFENGKSADIALNVKLEVEGTVNANGVLIAQKISIESEDKNGGESDKTSTDAKVETKDTQGTTSDWSSTEVGTAAASFDTSHTELSTGSTNDVPGDPAVDSTNEPVPAGQGSETGEDISVTGDSER